MNHEPGFHLSCDENLSKGWGPPLLITAHGVSNAERQRLAVAHKELIDTTCPLVRRAHDAAQELQAEGQHVLLIGKAGHVEVRGIVDDLDNYDVIGEAGDVTCYESRRLGVVCQTTMPPDVVTDVCSCIRRRTPWLIFASSTRSASPPSFANAHCST